MADLEDIKEADSARLYDHNTKTWVEVPAAEVPNRIATGKFTYAAGVEVPVISPEGERYTIPSEKAYEAFAEGFRPMTAAMSNQLLQLENEKALEARFANQPINAAIAGGLRGATLGLSDAVLAGAGVGDAAGQLKDRNATASMIGEGLGIAGSTLLAPLSVGARGAAAGGKALAGAAGLGEGLLGRAAVRAAEGAAEGMYFGLGSGISEAALGHPDSVVDALASNVGLGALVGGVFSGVLGTVGSEVAKPQFDKLVNRSVNKVADVVGAAGRKVLTVGAVPMLERRGLSELAAAFPELVDDPQFLKWAAENGGLKGVTAKAKQVLGELEPIAVAEKKAVESDIKQILTKSTEEGRQVINEALQQSGKNILEAAQLAGREIEASATNMERVFASQSVKEPVLNMQPVQKSITKLLDKIIDNPAMVPVFEKLQVLGGASRAVANQADEVRILRGIADTIEPYLEQKGPWRSAAGKLWSQVDEAILTHPNEIIAQVYGRNKVQSAALKDLRSLVDKVLDRQLVGTAAETKAFKALVNPESQAALNGVLDNIEQFAPDFAKLNTLRADVKNVAAKTQMQQDIEAKIKAAVPGAKVNIDQVEAVLGLIGKGGGDKLSRLKELREVLSPQASALDKAIAIGKALGSDTKELQSFASNMEKLQLMEKLSQVKMPGSNLVKGAIGSSIGGLPGLLYGLSKQSSNLANYTKNVANLQTAADAGAKLISKGVDLATQALVSKPVQRLVSNETAAFKTRSGGSIEQQRAQYANSKKLLASALTQQPTQREEVPGISSALQQKQQQVLKFIQSKLPEDPFASTSINALNTGYIPPDYDVSKFNRYVAAANDPKTVLASIASGKVTPEEVETLKTVWPRIFSDLQQSVMNAIVEKQGNIPYKQKVELATLFDIPTDYSMQSDFIVRMQEAINKSRGGRPEGGSQPKTMRGKLELEPNETIATSVSQITNKN